MIGPELKKKTVRRVSAQHQFKYDYLLMMLTITVFIMCDTTAFRPTLFWGVEIPLSGLILPMVFALSDVISEVYGFETTKKLIVNIIICQLIYSFGIHEMLSLNTPIGNSTNHHYDEAFKNIRWTSLTSCFSIPTGMYINSVILNSLKIKFNGRKLSLRGIVAGSIGELIICIVAYNFLFFWENKPYTEIFTIIYTVWFYRIVFTMVTVPFFVSTTRALKYLEGKEVFDYNVSYNPFKFKSNESSAIIIANDSNFIDEVKD